VPQTQADDVGETRVVQAGPETRSWLQLLTGKWPIADAPRPATHEGSNTRDPGVLAPGSK